MTAVTAPRDTLTGWIGGGALASGLLAGVYFGFACAVMPGLERSSDHTYVEAMRNINVVIENPVFFAAFFGAVLLPGIAWWQLRRGSEVETRRWTAVGFWLGVVGLVSTMAVNVPLNDHLTSHGPSSSAHLAALRDQFDLPWVVANIARTVTSIGATIALGRALVLRGRRCWPGRGRTDRAGLGG